MNRVSFQGTSRTLTENNNSGNNNFLQRFVRNTPNNNIILEEIIDVESDIINFNNNTIRLPNPRILTRQDHGLGIRDYFLIVQKEAYQS